jgi:cytochrome c553
MRHRLIVLTMAFGGMVQATAMPAPAVATAVPAAPMAAVAQSPVDQAQLCASCHNKDGNSTVPAWPSIAGQSPKYFLEQLKAFKAGATGPRPEPVMEGILGPLSMEELESLAAYFSKQTVVVGATPEAFVALGRQIYRGGNPKTGVPACAACHEARGVGNPLAGFPGLSGQQPDYIIQQLNNFRTGLRKNDPNAMMQAIAKRMSDEEIKAVANYVHGLH